MDHLVHADHTTPFYIPGMFAPTLAEQVAALAARWLIGPTRDEHGGLLLRPP